MSGLDWTILAGVVVAGAAVQGALGFGLNVLVAPVAALIDPDLVPAPLLLLGLAHLTGLLIVERHAVAARIRTRAGAGEHGRLRWILAGRLPGSVIGAWLIAVASSDSIEVIFGVSLLAMIGLGFVRAGLPRTRTVYAAAGVVSGVSGTAVSVGGPPVALVLAGAAPDEFRSSVATVQIFAAAMSVGAITIAGEVGTRDLDVAARLLPAMVAGLVLSRRVVGHLDRERTALAVNATAAAAALALLVKGLV